jgi:monothiol glutaredoxin
MATLQNAILDDIEKTLAKYPVVLYMKGTPDEPQCGFSSRAVKILNLIGCPFHTVDILADPELRQTLREHKFPTFPQLYVGAELVGGSDIMMEEYESGELQTKIEKTLQASKDA